jgi:hypothetical protein
MDTLAAPLRASPERDAASKPVERSVRGRSPWLVLAVVSAGMVMILVDTTIVNIAVPSIISGNAHMSEAYRLHAREARLRGPVNHAIGLVPDGRQGAGQSPSSAGWASEGRASGGYVLRALS